MGKNGRPRTEFVFTEVEEKGYGSVTVKKGGQWGAFHIGGFQLVPCQYDSIDQVSPQLFKAKEGENWALFSWTGEQLTPFIFAEVTMPLPGLLLGKRSGSYTLISPESLFKNSSAQSSKPFLYESFELLDKGFFKVKKGQLWQLRNISAPKKVYAKGFGIEKAGAFWVVDKGDRWFFLDITGSKIGARGYEDYAPAKNLMAVKTLGKWGVMNQDGKFLAPPSYDTALVLGFTGILLSDHEGFTICHPKTGLLKLGNAKRYTLLTEGHEMPFVLFESQSGKMGLINSMGLMVLKPNYDRIELAGGHLVAAKGHYRGLFKIDGEQLLTPSFQGIQYLGDSMFLVLKNRKFGMYDVDSETLSPMAYDTPPRVYNDTILIVKQNKYGLAKKNGVLLTPCLFEEVVWWDNETALVKQGLKWRLYDLVKNRFLGEAFDSFEYLRNDQEEVLIKTYRSSGYGILSSTKGRVLGEEYTEIRNIGSGVSPFYLAEVHVTQAKLFFYMYFDDQGKVIKEQTGRGDTFDKFSCHD